jgi:hypothetical protein
MAAIPSIDAGQIGPFASAQVTLSADDTLTFNSKRKQLLVLTNTTAGSLTATIDGSTSTTVSVPRVGSVDVSAGKAIIVGAGLSVSVALHTISAYCQGVVHITGAATLKAQLFDI